MKSSSGYLEAEETAGIRALIGELSRVLGANLLAVWLFGSKARGDGHAYSDIDLLIVVEQLAPPTRWRIRELAADCSLEYNVLVNTHILDARRWAEHTFYHSTLWREIETDGVPLYEASAVVRNESL